MDRVGILQEVDGISEDAMQNVASLHLLSSGRGKWKEMIAFAMHTFVYTNR